MEGRPLVEVARQVYLDSVDVEILAIKAKAVRQILILPVATEAIRDVANHAAEIEDPTIHHARKVGRGNGKIDGDAIYPIAQTIQLIEVTRDGRLTSVRDGFLHGTDDLTPARDSKVM